MVFTGFDSAWGGRQAGAICDLETAPGGGLAIRRLLAGVTWPVALREFAAYQDTQHVVAIDQPLVVPNASGMRPVEAGLASALMRDFACGAHAANTGNASCFGAGAGIWDLLELLVRREYVQSPGQVAVRTPGKYCFECYPHPAILGIFDLPKVVRYKVRHRDANAWKDILGLVASLRTASPAVANVEAFFPASLPQTKANEDAIDSLVSAYVGSYLFAHGYDKSIVLGDLTSGYIATPVLSSEGDCTKYQKSAARSFLMLGSSQKTENKAR